MFQHIRFQCQNDVSFSSWFIDQEKVSETSDQIDMESDNEKSIMVTLLLGSYSWSPFWASFLVLKAQGVQGLAKDLGWLYSYFNPSVIRSMKPQYFFIVTREGALGLGSFPFHDWYERENILKAVGIKVEYGEMLKEAEFRGTFKTVAILNTVRWSRCILKRTWEWRILQRSLTDPVGRLLNIFTSTTTPSSAAGSVPPANALEANTSTKPQLEQKPKAYMNAKMTTLRSIQRAF